MNKRFLVLALALSTACSGETAGVGDGGTADAPIGDAPPGTLDARGPDAFVADAVMGTPCGGGFCDPMTQKCCVSHTDAGAETRMCIPVADSCGGPSASCDGPEDCGAGEVCCRAGANASCAASCTGVVVCHVDEDCSGKKCCANPTGGDSTCLPVTTCPPVP